MKGKSNTSDEHSDVAGDVGRENPVAFQEARGGVELGNDTHGVSCCWTVVVSTQY